MDELEYRLRDLDAVADQAGRLPSPSELRRRGDRRRTIRRAQVAVGTFAVVAVVAGGMTAWLGQSNTTTTGVPAAPTRTASASTAPVVPEPSETGSATTDPAPTTGDEELPNITSDRLDHSDAGDYWVWAPPTSGGRRGLALSGDDVLDLSTKNKKKYPDVLPYYGQLTLIPVGKSNQYQITNLFNSEEADAYCVTVVEAGFDMEVCDDTDVKQRLTFTETKGGYLIGSQSQGVYLRAEGRKIVQTGQKQEATEFAVEKRAQE